MATLGAIVLLALSATSCRAAEETAPPPSTERREAVLATDEREHRVSLLSGGATDSPTVLLLHGGRFDAATWERLGTLDLLVERGFRVVALDLPGFGASPAAPVGDPVAFLAALIDTLDLGRPVLVSPSMSGRFALPLVAATPERLRGWIALAPVAIEDHLDDLEGNALPTLLLWGDSDTVVAPEQGRALAERLEDARLVVLEGAGHPAYLERPEVFHAELLDFLGDLFDDGARRR